MVLIPLFDILVLTSKVTIGSITWRTGAEQIASVNQLLKGSLLSSSPLEWVSLMGYFSQGCGNGREALKKLAKEVHQTNERLDFMDIGRLRPSFHCSNFLNTN